MSDGRNYGFEFNWLDVSLVLRGESRPLPDFVPILIKIGRKGENYAWRQFRTAAPEGVLYGLGQVLSIESEGAGKDLQIVEVFHAAVGDPKFNHRFKFFGDDRLSGIVKLVFTCAKMNRKEQQ